MTSSSFVGLLLSADALEAVQYRQEGDGTLHVECHHRLRAEAPLLDPDGAPADPEAFRALLVRFWEETGLTSREVVLGVAGRKAIARTTVLPAMPATQLPRALRAEAEQFAGLRGEMPCVDYFTLDADGERSSIFYAAIASRLVAGYQDVFTEARLVLKAVEPSTYASARALAHLKPEATEAWNGVVLQPGRVVFMSWFGPQLLHWRESHVEPWEAGNADSRARWLTAELGRFQGEQSSERDVLVAGQNLVESAQLADDFRRLGAERALPSGLVEWGHRLPQAALDGISPAALGLALHGLEASVPALDLQRLSPAPNATRPLAEAPEHAALFAAPPAPMELAVQRPPSPAFSIGLTAALAFFVGLGAAAAVGAGLAAWNARIEHRLPALTAQGTQLEARLAYLNREADQLQRLAGPEAGPNLAVRILGQLNALVPSEAWLTAIASPQRDRLVLHGEATEQEAPLVLARKLAEFVEVSQVKVVELRRTRPGHFRFVVEASLAAAPDAPSVP